MYELNDSKVAMQEQVEVSLATKEDCREQLRFVLDFSPFVRTRGSQRRKKTIG